MFGQVCEERRLGIAALFREQADAVLDQYPADPQDLSQHIQARADLPKALRFVAKLLEEAQSPMEEEDLRIFLDVFGMGIEELTETVDPLFRYPERYWDRDPANE